jgi:low temperature requirement protein LtrA
MSSVIRNFRQWWQPPRKTIDRDRERSVTFLELFYDLVYVVIIAELSHSLAGHVNWQGVLGFAFLFVLVWFAWLNGSMYHDLHGNNDVRTRFFTFLQMFTVAAMAVFAHNAFGEGAAGFALAFAAYQLTLTYLWWRTGVHDPLHRPLSRPYVLSFLASTALFIVSAFVPEPWRYYLWGISLVLSLGVQVVSSLSQPDDPAVREEQEHSWTMTPSAVERFGLFTIIVLGEVIVGVVRGVAGHHHLTWIVGLTAALGMLIAIGLWWLYFDSVSHRLPIAGPLWTGAWIYLHLFAAMGIVATGAAALNVVEHAGEPLTPAVTWLLTGALAVALASIALLMATLQLPQEHRSLYRRAGWITLFSALVALLMGATNLAPIPLLIVLIVLLLLPVFYGLKVWITVFGAQEFTLD